MDENQEPIYRTLGTTRFQSRVSRRIYSKIHVIRVNPPQNALPKQFIRTHVEPQVLGINIPLLVTAYRSVFLYLLIYMYGVGEVNIIHFFSKCRRVAL
jgi:hypothetical protein